MSIFLEVIATSVEEAVAAQEGGADRLELVRDLDAGGLSPSPELVKEVLANVDIPVRVMVREADSMLLHGDAELQRLKRSVSDFCECSIDGIVVGYISGGRIDCSALENLIPERLPVTFHRAFDEVSDGASAISELKTFPQIDRILTRAGGDSWHARKDALDKLQALAAPEIRMLFAIGRDTSHLHELHQSQHRYEVHVGRAARLSHRNSGAVSATYVAALKRYEPVADHAS
jgi:copper homeostasis protein